MAIKTVIGAIRSGAREFFGRLIGAKTYGAAAISSFMHRFPELGRAGANELYARLRGEVTVNRNLLTANAGTRLPASTLPTNQRQVRAYRGQVEVTLRDQASGYSRTLVVRPGFEQNPTIEQLRAEAVGIAQTIVEHTRSPGMPEDPDMEIVGLRLISLTRRR